MMSNPNRIYIASTSNPHKYRHPILIETTLKYRRRIHIESSSNPRRILVGSSSNPRRILINIDVESSSIRHRNIDVASTSIPHRKDVESTSIRRRLPVESTSIRCRYDVDISM